MAHNAVCVSPRAVGPCRGDIRTWFDSTRCLWALLSRISRSSQYGPRTLEKTRRPPSVVLKTPASPMFTAAGRSPERCWGAGGPAWCRRWRRLPRPCPQADFSFLRTVTKYSRPPAQRAQDRDRLTSLSGDLDQGERLGFERNPNGHRICTCDGLHLGRRQASGIAQLFLLLPAREIRLAHRLPGGAR